MAPKPKPRPPKKGSAEAKALISKKNGSKDDLVSVFDKMGVNDEVAHDDGGRVATGNLISEERARDIKIQSFSLALHGHPLVEDTMIELNRGGRYGLLGRNGCGKSTFLKCLANREVPIPKIFDIYLLAHEAPPGEETALEYVINSAKNECARLGNNIYIILLIILILIIIIIIIIRCSN